MDLYDVAVARKLSSGGGGGGGSSDFSTATITATYTLPEGKSVENLKFNGGYLNSVDSDFNYIITYNYGDNSGIPVSKLGSVSQITIPVYDIYPTGIINMGFEIETGVLAIDIVNTSIVSGNATKDEYDIYVSGDCTLNIALIWAD